MASSRCACLDYLVPIASALTHLTCLLNFLLWYIFRAFPACIVSIGQTVSIFTGTQLLRDMLLLHVAAA